MTTENMDTKRMRIHNSQRVLRVVKKLGPISRADVTRHTRLSPPTVSALVQGLLNAGLVEERGEGTSNGGRRPQLISFNAGCGVILGANIGSSALQLALADMNGDILEKRCVPLGADTRPRSIARRLGAAARAISKNTLSSQTPLLAAAIGAPGMTDMERGVVLEAVNLDGWVDVPARDLFAKELNAPVTIENDVNLAAVGEHWRGGGREARNLVFIAIGTGIGAGIIIEGKLYRGHRWHAGEISRLNVDYHEWETNFGAAGYLESYLKSAPGKKMRRAARPACGALNDEAVLQLGTAVANIATIIDPELIVCGGRRAISTPELLPRLHRVATRIAPNCPAIRLTELGEEAALIGSLRTALNLANEALYETANHSPAAVVA